MEFLYLHDFDTKLVEPLILLALVLQSTVLFPWKGAAHLNNQFLLPLQFHRRQFIGVACCTGNHVVSRGSKLGCNRPTFPICGRLL